MKSLRSVCKYNSYGRFLHFCAQFQITRTSLKMTTRETISPPSLLVVGLQKENFHRTCDLHECCGDHLRPGMVVQFKLVEFPTRGGKTENAVEAWCRIQEGGRPPSPSASGGPPRCKVGWLERHVALAIGDKLNGKCAVTHKLLDDGDKAERRTSRLKNGAARVYLVAELPNANPHDDIHGVAGKRQRN